MIGVGKIQMAGEEIPTEEYAVNINPGELNTQSSNGGTSSASIEAFVLGGVGPFTYLWSVDNESITINKPDKPSTNFNCGGFNTEVFGRVTITITDTGASDLEVTGEALISFSFGTLK